MSARQIEADATDMQTCSSSLALGATEYSDCNAVAAKRKTIIISGVTSGLGKALLEFYVEEGHKVYGCARRGSEIYGLRAKWPSADLRVLDVIDDDGVKAWAEDISDAEIVICNAGVSPESNKGLAAWEVAKADFDLTVDVNVKGVMNMVRHFTPALIKSGRGVLVALSSGLGRSSNPTHAAYCASKWAIEGLMKSVAMALPAPLTAVPLAPGVVATEMQQGDGDGDLREWVQVAAPMILRISRAQNGASLSVPGFYTEKYKDTWVVPDGAALLAELGHNF